MTIIIYDQGRLVADTTVVYEHATASKGVHQKLVVDIHGGRFAFASAGDTADVYMLNLMHTYIESALETVEGKNPKMGHKFAPDEVTILRGNDRHTLVLTRKRPYVITDSGYLMPHDESQPWVRGSGQEAAYMALAFGMKPLQAAYEAWRHTNTCGGHIYYIDKKDLNPYKSRKEVK